MVLGVIAAACLLVAVLVAVRCMDRGRLAGLVIHRGEDVAPAFH